MAGPEAKAEQRVCASCGNVPGDSVHCGNCGVNLVWRPRLPTRKEWEAKNGEAPPASNPGTDQLRYTARDLTELHMGPRRFRRGRLMLLLSLKNTLNPAEKVKIFINATDSSTSPCWLVLTSERLLCFPKQSAIMHRQAPLQAFPLGEMTDIRSPRLISNSFSFTAGDAKVHYSLKGRNATKRLVRLLQEATGGDDR